MPNSFTPEEISQIIEEFFRVVGTRQYIGARYVPIFGRKGEDSIQWDNTAPYEPLTIVLYQGDSYTSRQYVPVGVDITNENFWALTGNYNAQIEAYRQEVQGFDSRITATEDAVEDMNQTLADTVDEVNDMLSTVADATGVPHHLHPLGQFNNKNDTYVTLQAGCMVDDALMLAYLKQTEDGSAEMRLINPDSGNIIERHVVRNGGHFQSIAYNAAKNVTYIADYTGTSVHIMDMSTFTIADSFNTGNNIVAIAYYNNLLYCISKASEATQSTVQVYDVTDVPTIVQTFYLQNGTFGGGRGAIDANVHNNMLNVMYVGGIASFDINTGALTEYHPFDTNIDDTWSLTEVEFFTYENDTDYILGFIVYSSTTVGGFQSHLSGITRFEEKRNALMPTNVVTGWRIRNRTCYVDSGVNTYQCDGSKAHPFSSIYQALNALVGVNYANGYVSVIDNDPNEAIYIAGSMTRDIFISGYNSYVPTFSGVYVRDNVCLIFNTEAHFHKQDFSRYIASATNVYFACVNDSKIIVATGTTAIYLDGAAGIYNQRGCTIIVSLMHNITGADFHNSGYLKSNYPTIVTINGTIANFGEVHGFAFDSDATLPSTNATFKIPNNGVVMLITGFLNGVMKYGTFPIKPTTYNQRISMGSNDVLAECSGITQDGATVSLSVTASGDELRYLHLLCD